MNRSERLGFLVRRNTGRMRTHAVLAELSAQWGCALTPGDVGRLEAADELRAVVQSRGLAFRAWEVSAEAAIGHVIGALGQRIDPRGVFFLPYSEDQFGPIRIDPRAVFPHAMATTRGRSEEFLACSATGGEGIYLMYHRSDAEHGYPCPIELAIWGKSWLAAAAEVMR
jgi:hypothetical protein